MRVGVRARRRGVSGEISGSQPVSLSRDNMSLLKSQPYSVTWKADGTRYMLLLMRDGAYLVDRKFGVRRRADGSVAAQKFGTSVHHCTLMDGEMVVDTDPQTKKETRRYLAYDLMAINGERVTQRPFLERLNIIRVRRGTKKSVSRASRTERSVRGAQGAVFGSYQGIPSAQVRAHARGKVHPGSLPRERRFNFPTFQARRPQSVRGVAQVEISRTQLGRFSVTRLERQWITLRG